MIHYTHCPACGSADIHLQLSAKDHTVSQETFAIWHCTHCTLRFTQDIPAQKAIGPYYKAESYISHSDTQQGLVNKLYHFVRKQTLAGKRKLVIQQTGLLKGTILDVGCGTGAFLNHMKLAGWGITGLEPDETARQKAVELYNLQPGNAEALFQQKAGSFNAITLWHVLEHVHELQEYLRQLHEILAPGGLLFIAVPNYTSKDAAQYGDSWAAWDVPRHLYHFSPPAMQQLLEKHGFVLKKMKPMWFDSFYVSMLSEQYRFGKGNIIRAFFRGLQSNLAAMRDAGKCSSIIYIIAKK